MAKPSHERGKYLRIETPLKVRAINKDNVICDTQTKDISPLGLRFEVKEDIAGINDELDLTLEIPNSLSPIHAKAKVVWKKSLSTADKSPQDIGCEFKKIEEDNKNTFLKYFCDLLYERGGEGGKKGEV